jgi:hypothetical protein
VAHSVRLAHQETPSKWGLRLNGDSIMLKVGFVEVLQLGEGWFHILVESDRISKEVRRKNHLLFNRDALYRNAPGCETCDMDDIPKIASGYADLLLAHEEAIRIAARSRIHTSTTKDHSPGLITFISQELNTPLFQPDYVKLSETLSIPEELTEEDFKEGGAIRVLVNRYERDPAARQKCINHYYGVRCIICDVSLSEQYGPEVAGLIEVHHLTPLASIGKRSSVDPIRDLRPVCPNCHAVIHATKPPRTLEQVKEMLPNR